MIIPGIIETLLKCHQHRVLQDWRLTMRYIKDASNKNIYLCSWMACQAVQQPTNLPFVCPSGISVFGRVGTCQAGRKEMALWA